MKKRILIVDDEQHFRFAAGLALRRKGYRVAEAADGGEALEEMRNSRRRGDPFDLLITDIHMSPSGGIELLDRVREEGFGVPVLVISGYFDDRLFAELIEKKYLDYLEKPLALEDLVGRVEHLVEAERETHASLAEVQAEGRRPSE